MLIFRTILLWLAFLLLVFLEFFEENDLRLGIIFRLLPSILLFIWFVAHIAYRQRYQFKYKVSQSTLRIVNFSKIIANTAIVSGAVLKIWHLPYSQLFIIAGIGFLSVWSTFLVLFSEEKPKYNPEIIDDLQDDLGKNEF